MRTATNRQILRLCLLLVIGVGLLGGWYANQRWEAVATDLEFEVTSEIDWADVLSSLAENSIRFFQGATATSE